MKLTSIIIRVVLSILGGIFLFSYNENAEALFALCFMAVWLLTLAEIVFYANEVVVAFVRKRKGKRVDE